MAINKNGVQVEQQYIGARYVPKFFQGAGGSPEWVAGLTYEALTIVTYLGNSFTSKIPVPAGIGNPADNPGYWVNTGNYNAQMDAILKEFNGLKNSIVSKESTLVSFNNVNELRNYTNFTNGMCAFVSSHNGNDNGYAFYSISQNESGLSDNDGDIIVAENYVAKMVPLETVELCAFGCTEGKDCSINVQNAVNFARKNGIKTITCSTNIMFSDCVLNDSVTFDFLFNTIQCIRFHPNTNRVKTIFLSNKPIHFKLLNANIKGYNDVDDSGEKPSENSPLEFTGSKSVIISHCNFDTFKTSYMEISPIFAQRKGVLYTILDCDFTSINYCNFNNLRGEELGFCLAVIKERYNVNAEMHHCYFGENINTSICDFLGNNFHIFNNVYNHNYQGSIQNCFALNLNVHDELINGNVKNAYDNCEETCFQGITADISKITITGTVGTLAEISAASISIHEIKSDKLSMVCVVRKGFGTSTAFDPHVGNVAIPNVEAIIYNCIFGGATLIFCDGNPSSNINVIITKVKNGAKQKSIIGGNQNFYISNCTFTNTNDSGFGSIPIWCYFQTKPKNLFLTNVIFNNAVSGAEEYVVANVNNLIITGCVTNGSNNKTSNITTLKTANNIGILES